MERPPDLDALLRDLLALPPDEQPVRLARLANRDEVLCEMAERAGGWAITDLDRALVATERLVEIGDAVAGPLARAQARRARAQVLACADRHDEALEAAHASVRLAEEAHETVAAARARMSMVRVLDGLGRTEESIAIGAAALAAFRAEGEEVLAARAEVNLGIAHRLRNDPAAALECFDRARHVLDGDAVIAAQIDSNRAEALLDLNEFSRAEEAFRSALATFEGAGVARAAAIVEGNLADLMSRQGRLDRALYHFERARRHFEAGPEAGDLGRRARLEAEQAEAFARAGLVPEALASYRAALPRLEEHGMAWEGARARAGLGQALAASGRKPEAEAELDRAARAFGELGNEAAYARTRLVQGEVAATRGAGTEARALFREAEHLLCDRPAEHALARHHLARLALAENQLEEAERLLEPALASAQACGVAPLLADLHHSRGRLRSRQGRTAAALEDLRAAVAEVERLRGALPAERLRAAFLGDRAVVYEDLVLTLLAGGGEAAVREAYATVERAKSRSLLELAAGALEADPSPPAEGGPVPAVPLLRDAARLRRELSALYSRFEDVAPGPRDRLPVRRWRVRVEQLERELQTLESRLASTRGPAAGVVPPRRAGGAPARGDRPAAILEYFIAGEALVAFVVREDSLSVHANLASRAEVVEHVERLQFETSRAAGWAASAAGVSADLVEDARHELYDLHAMLMAPLREELDGIEALTIVPHGPLHGVPFHALYDGGRYLLEDYRISSAPSASVLRHLSACPAPAAPGRRLVVGVPDAVAPAIGEEARAIGRMIEAETVLVGEAATRARFARAAPGASLVHLACHARFSPTAPLASGVRLADGWMTVREVYGLGLNEPLVVLSACETGRSEVGKGDELTGLVRGFVAAGASAVVVSLWMLNDQSARNLMGRFYRMWYNGGGGEGRGVASALRSAQLQVMDRHPHPVFWAPLVMLGRP